MALGGVNKPSWESVVALAKAVRVPIEELLVALAKTPSETRKRRKEKG
jgi:hypothetical protein